MFNSNQPEYLTDNRFEWMKAAIAGNHNHDSYAMTDTGDIISLTAEGQVIGAWDNFTQFGYVESEYSYCPIGEELDDQLIAAECQVI